MTTEGFFQFRAKVTPARGGSAGEAMPAGAKPLTVSQLTARIERAIKEGLPRELYVKGELSNYSVHGASGHHYFTLKDSTACIDCVMWGDEAARLKFAPRNGMEVVATGRVAVYAQRGKHQLYVSELQPLGQGALELAFRQRREKLEKEGLFDAQRKRPLPRFPMRIGIITSRHTAALADMLKVLRRYPWLRIFLDHVPVQGESAGPQIAAALRHLDQQHHTIGGIDLIVLGRGGGSLEDLWCFNDESVARAIAASSIPVVTGIGHEVDTSIADLVADYHAHTPTEAAQVITHHWRSVRDTVLTTGLRLDRGVRQLFADSRRRLAQIERHETFRRPAHRLHVLQQLLDDREKALALEMSERFRTLRRRCEELSRRVDEHRPSLLIARLRERLSADQHRVSSAIDARLRAKRIALDRSVAALGERHPRHRIRLAEQHLTDLAARFGRAATEDLNRRTEKLEALSRQLIAVGPAEVLRRGFSLTFRKKDGLLIRSAAQIKPGDRMVTRFADGEIEWTAEDVRQLRLFT